MAVVSREEVGKVELGDTHGRGHKLNSPTWRPTPVEPGVWRGHQGEGAQKYLFADPDHRWPTTIA